MSKKWVYVGWADMGEVYELDGDDPLLQQSPETANPPYFIIGDSSGLPIPSIPTRLGAPSDPYKQKAG